MAGGLIRDRCWNTASAPQMIVVWRRKALNSCRLLRTSQVHVRHRTWPLSIFRSKLRHIETSRAYEIIHLPVQMTTSRNITPNRSEPMLPALVRTIGRRSESQSTRPKSVLSGSPRARQCRTACRPSWRWHSRVENKHRTRNSVMAITARGLLPHRVLICLRILTGRSVACRSVSFAATGLGSKMVAGCSVFVR